MAGEVFIYIYIYIYYIYIYIGLQLHDSSLAPKKAGELFIYTSPEPEKCINTSPATPPEKYLYTLSEKYLYAPPEKYLGLYTSPAPKKYLYTSPEKYLYTSPSRRSRKSIYIHRISQLKYLPLGKNIRETFEQVVAIINNYFSLHS